MSGDRIEHAFLALVLSVIAVIPAYAADTVRNVRITLGPDCPADRDVYLVVHDDDSEQGLQFAERISGRTWIAHLKSEKRFSSESRIHFSVRIIGFGRTTCRRFKWDDKEHAADVVFSCREADVKQIKVEPKASSPFRYGREVLRIRSDDPHDVDCFEMASLSHTIREVQFDIENLRLPFSRNPKDRCGLIVDNLEKIRRAQKGKPVPFSRDDVVQSLASQRVKADCAMPHLSVGAIDLNEKNLDQAKLKEILFTVE